MKSAFFILAASAALAAGALSFQVAAQTAPAAAPTSEQMIEQLKAPRTRSLRNLSVEAAAPAAASTTATYAPNPAPANTALAAAAAGAAPVAAAPKLRPSLSLLIQFDFDSARVRPVSQQALANLAAALQSKELQDSKFVVEGHTDAKGRADYNLRLSQQRADTVRDLLATQGVKLDRLKAQGKGSSELALPASPDAAENRRVRIVNLD